MRLPAASHAAGCAALVGPHQPLHAMPAPSRRHHQRAQQQQQPAGGGGAGAPPPPLRPPRRRPAAAARAAAPAVAAADSAAGARAATLLCTSLTADTVDGMLAEAAEAAAAGADVAELRLDYLAAFSPEADLPRLLAGCPLPAIATFRPTWEGGKYGGPEAERLGALKLAAALGAAYVDVELAAAGVWAAAGGTPPREGAPPGAPRARLILSSHDYERTPPAAELDALLARCAAAGADVAKVATTARDVADAVAVLGALARWSARGGVPAIALAMGERGLPTRLLAPKYGGHLTFGALSPARASAPGQPTLGALRGLYRLPAQRPSTRVLGIVGNPVGHSRSPAIHNAALAAAGADAVYVPLLTDDLPRLLAALGEHLPGGGADWAGLSVTIPHKEAALAAAAEADPVAAAIGAANTLVRRPAAAGGGFAAHNTDWAAAVGAIEAALGGSGEVSDATAAASPLRGRTVVVVGAGGAGRALAFGAASRCAAVVVANRARGRAEALAAALAAALPGAPPPAVAGLDDLAAGRVRGDVLANTTSVGMAGESAGDTPVPAAALPGFAVVFDAVYTPLRTRLLREAEAAGCTPVTGEAMFVGQGERQFRLFTGRDPPPGLMRAALLESLGGAAGGA